MQFATQTIEGGTHQACEIAGRLLRVVDRNRDLACGDTLLVPTTQLHQHPRPTKKTLNYNSHSLIDPEDLQHKAQLLPPGSQRRILAHPELDHIAFAATTSNLVRQRAVCEGAVAVQGAVIRHSNVEVDGRGILGALGPVPAAGQARLARHHVQLHVGDAPYLGGCVRVEGRGRRGGAGVGWSGKDGKGEYCEA